ncbi:MAG: hypothetical protein ABL958_12965, partial [Bdellovibrionia bacterium]
MPDSKTKAPSKIFTKQTGAGIVGFFASALLFILATVLFVTENYFVSLLLISFALLAYVVGSDAARVLFSSFAMFFSRRHLVAEANDIEDNLLAIQKGLHLTRDEKGEIHADVLKDGQAIILPDNALSHDLRRLINDGRGFDYVEYVAHSRYVECHELYDNASANLDFIAVSMPVFGLIGTVI